ncbi:MAG: hypothetical protein QOE70_4046 [Chthoniobacter sp.]|jgi:hypothetical protein|nr:hypothetical protein [Chthoniobacter sp.]
MKREQVEKEREAARYWPGINSGLRITPFGAAVHPRENGEWRHPWNVQMDYVGREWCASINPGFVNGRPAFIDMPAEWIGVQVATGEAQDRDFGVNPLTGKPYFSDWVFKRGRGTSAKGKSGGPGGPVRITNSPAPYLVLNAWRDPVAAGPLSATDDGELLAGRGEGYPPFFATVGVRAPFPGGAPGTVGKVDPARTCEIRAMDLVLVQPRIGSRLNFTTGNPIATTATQNISTVYLNDYVTLHNGRARLRATRKHIPLAEQDIEAVFGTLLNNGDPQYDELRMATVWMVSPPAAGSEAVPDETWQPYVQHFVFWNLNHAPRNSPPEIHQETEFGLLVPLALGTAQGIINGILSVINGMLNEALAFLRQSGDTRGNFWNT